MNCFSQVACGQLSTQVAITLKSGRGDFVENE
jgi:hypothetical protein